eukprot:GHVN01043667.1.p1 GENE.GHVN01043667.1~~GHVN01043667.1.p1  ORF type:complete len:804 (+),score=119.38 GHVN01043667.1:425-2836(+)
MASSISILAQAEPVLHGDVKTIPPREDDISALSEKGTSAPSDCNFQCNSCVGEQDSWREDRGNSSWEQPNSHQHYDAVDFQKQFCVDFESACPPPTMAHSPLESFPFNDVVSGQPQMPHSNQGWDPYSYPFHVMGKVAQRNPQFEAAPMHNLGASAGGADDKVGCLTVKMMSSTVHDQVAISYGGTGQGWRNHLAPNTEAISSPSTSSTDRPELYDKVKQGIEHNDEISSNSSDNPRNSRPQTPLYPLSQHQPLKVGTSINHHYQPHCRPLSPQYPQGGRQSRRRRGRNWPEIVDVRSTENADDDEQDKAEQSKERYETGEENMERPERDFNTQFESVGDRDHNNTPFTPSFSITAPPLVRSTEIAQSGEGVDCHHPTESGGGSGGRLTDENSFNFHGQRGRQPYSSQFPFYPQSVQQPYAAIVGGMFHQQPHAHPLMRPPIHIMRPPPSPLYNPMRPPQPHPTPLHLTSCTPIYAHHRLHSHVPLHNYHPNTSHFPPETHLRLNSLSLQTCNSTNLTQQPHLTDVITPLASPCSTSASPSHPTNIYDMDHASLPPLQLSPPALEWGDRFTHQQLTQQPYHINNHYQGEQHQVNHQHRHNLPLNHQHHHNLNHNQHHANNTQHQFGCPTNQSRPYFHDRDAQGLKEAQPSCSNHIPTRRNHAQQHKSRFSTNLTGCPLIQHQPASLNHPQYHSAQPNLNLHHDYGFKGSLTQAQVERWPILKCENFETAPSMQLAMFNYLEGTNSLCERLGIDSVHSHSDDGESGERRQRGGTGSGEVLEDTKEMVSASERQTDSRSSESKKG